MDIVTFLDAVTGSFPEYAFLIVRHILTPDNSFHFV